MHESRMKWVISETGASLSRVSLRLMQSQHSKAMRWTLKISGEITMTREFRRSQARQAEKAFDAIIDHTTFHELIALFRG